MKPDLDPKAPANVRDPYPLYTWLREHEPVHWSDELHAWIVTRYADVREVFDRPGRFSSDRFRNVDERFASPRTEVREVASVLRDWLVFRDPPDHTRLRALLQKTFTPRQIEKNRIRIQAAIDELLDAASPRGEMDFIADFAFPLPAMVIALLLGAPTGDIDSIKRWSDELGAYLGGSIDDRDNFSVAREGAASLVDYFRRLLREKRAQPSDDLMCLMLRAEHEGQSLSEEEVIANCVLLLFAGHETTTNLLGNGLYHLLRHPGELAALRAESARVERAVEELLRFDGPVPATTKVAMEDCTWHGTRIRRGELVLPFLNAANRDPRQFDRPDVLDVHRHPNRHLSFAWGIHFCLGAPLARLEATLALRTLLRRLPDLELVDSDPPWRPWIFLRGLESLRITWGGQAGVGVVAPDESGA